MILLGILLLSCVCLVIIRNTEEKKDEIRSEERLVLNIDPDNVNYLYWKYPGRALSFKKEDGKWTYKEDSEFPVDEEKIRNLVSIFHDFRSAFVIEKPEDISEYGLDEPVCTIHLTEEEANFEILLGSYSMIDEQRYVSVGDGNVYLIRQDPFRDFQIAYTDLIRNDEIPAFEQAEKITVSAEDTFCLEYLENSQSSLCAEDVYFIRTEDGMLPLDTGKVEAFLDSIRSLSLTELVTYQATDEKLASCGLTDPETVIEVTADGGQTAFTVSIGLDREKAAEKEEKGESLEGVTAYVRLNQSKIIYEMADEQYPEITKASADTLRHEELFTASFDQVESIEAELDGETYTITVKKDEETGETVFLFDGNEFDSREIKNSLLSLKTSGYTGEEPEKKAELSLLIHLDSETSPELRMVFYRYNGTDCIAEIQGETVSFTPRGPVIDLIEALNKVILG